MKAFDQVFTLEVNKSREEIIKLLEINGHPVVERDEIIINHNPAWFRFFTGRGIIHLKLGTTTAAASSMQCILSPSVADAKTIAIFLACNIPVWALLVYFYPWNVSLFVIFFVEWLMMAFIAIPVLIITGLAVCIYLLTAAFTWQSIYFAGLIISFLLLLINASIRYNRGNLRNG